MIEVIEHTADVRLRITGGSIEAIFREALRGTMQLLHPHVAASEVEREVDVTSADRTTLLIDFLNEALSNAHVHREAYDDAAFRLLSDTRAVARLLGRASSSFGEDVKAVTYHGAEVRLEPEGMFSVTIVYDI